MPPVVIRGLLLLLGAALLGPAAAHAQPVAYTIETIAMQGDPSPIGGTMHQLIGGVDIDADGRVLFHTYVDPLEPGEEMIVLYENGSLQTVLRDGDVAAGTGGAGFVTFNPPRLGAGGAMAWKGWYPLPSLEIARGAFARSSGVDVALALPGQPAPGGGVYVDTYEVHAMNAAGDVAFHGAVESGGPIAGALLLARSTGLVQVMRAGDPAPASVGGVFGALAAPWTPGLAADGSVIFWSEVQGGNAPHAVFRWSPGAPTVPVLLQGDPLQSPEGGTIEFINQSLESNVQGDLCFGAHVSRAGDPFPMLGIYVLEGGQHREVIRRGDPLPGMDGETFLTLIGPFGIDGAGEVAFAARTEQMLRDGIFASRGSAIVKLAAEGDPVIGMPGETWFGFSQVAVNDAGQVAFYAGTTAGPGIFLATPVAAEVPFAPPWAFAVLGIALAALGARRIRLQPRRSAA
jgi:hypothetical protein